MKSTLLAIGAYYIQIGMAERATPYLERLHKLAPQDNGVKLSLAESLDAVGKKAEASQLYQELRGTGSHSVPALHYFSQNEPPDGSEALKAEIEQVLSRPDLGNSSCRLLHASLGFLHQKQGNYPAAFAHFASASALRPQVFDINQYRAWVDGVIAVFGVDFFRKHSNTGNPAAIPVLVVGMPRSGTTLAEQMIANHRQAAGAGELPRIETFAVNLNCAPTRNIAAFGPSLAACGTQGLRQMGDNYVDLLKFHAPEAERVIDKMPHNFQFLGLIALLCPNARIIHMTRDPADTCLSCFQNPLSDYHAYSKDLTQLGLYYREYRRLMDHWKAVLPLPIYELNYEQLTADFEGESRKVIDFIGLGWDEACLSFHRAERTVRTLSKYQVRDPVHENSVGRWRRYEKELWPLLTALQGV